MKILKALKQGENINVFFKKLKKQSVILMERQRLLYTKFNQKFCDGTYNYI